MRPLLRDSRLVYAQLQTAAIKLLKNPHQVSVAEIVAGKAVVLKRPNTQKKIPPWILFFKFCKIDRISFI